MALYDNYLGAEQRLRYDESNQIPKLAAPVEYAQTPSGQSGELSPNFIGGSVDTTTGNLVPGTKQKVMRGSKATALPTPTVAPAAPSSLLSTV
jgi:hypothetical protein